MCMNRIHQVSLVSWCEAVIDRIGRQPIYAVPSNYYYKSTKILRCAIPGPVILKLRKKLTIRKRSCRLNLRKYSLPCRSLLMLISGHWQLILFPIIWPFSNWGSKVDAGPPCLALMNPHHRSMAPWCNLCLQVTSNAAQLNTSCSQIIAAASTY